MGDDFLPPVLSVSEAARLARLTPKAVRDLLREGKVRGSKLGGVWRVPTGAWLDMLGIDELDAAAFLARAE